MPGPGWQAASEADGQMINGSKVTIRLAAVQTRSLPRPGRGELGHAAGLVEQAVTQGAMMAVPPEFSSCGYVPKACTASTG